MDNSSNGEAYKVPALFKLILTSKSITNILLLPVYLNYNNKYLKQ